MVELKFIVINWVAIFTNEFDIPVEPNVNPG
jgi:hypothetical protein